MITLTIDEALKGTHDVSGHYIYLYRDQEVVFYVGRSYYPLNRLLQHMALDGTSLGDITGDTISDNLPASLHWTMELYTLEECKEAVQTHYKGSYHWYCKHIQAMDTSLAPPTDLICKAEQAMIEKYNPCLNAIGNRTPSTLPDRYIKRKISNEGVNLA